MMANGTAPAIRCHNLSRRYGDVQALNSLDLSIPAGSIFGFLGRNGAGKTTTIRLLTGLAQPTTGSAWVAGVETTQADSAARQVFGYLPQDPAFYGWMTPVDFLNYVARLFGLEDGERRQRVEEMLELVDLTEARNRRIGGFSGGMVQRLGLAQALIHRPPVLFLDEPTSSLDPAGRYAVLDLISRLRGEVTVFLSSHILGDVERVCDLVGIIHHGELLLVANRDELLAEYATKAIVLELDRDGESEPAGLASVLERQPWVTNVNADGRQLRIAVNDLATAKRELLPLLVAQNVLVARYEWVRPTLEEVFLSISA